MIKSFQVQESDFSSDLYHPIFVFDEDRQLDNTFSVLQTDWGDIFLSYYNYNLPLQYLLKGVVLYLKFGTSCAVVNLDSKEMIFYQKGPFAMIFEIIDVEEKQIVLMIGELTAKFFNYQGKLLSDVGCHEIITDWNISKKGTEIVYFDDSHDMIEWSKVENLLTDN